MPIANLKTAIEGIAAGDYICMSKKVKLIIKKLEKVHGEHRISRADPLNELVLTILSQNTSDVNRDRAMKSLKRQFDTWESVMEAKPNTIANAIKIGGLANIKSRRIKKILQDIYVKNGKLSLEFLKNLSAAQIKNYLRSFKGVGPKTAACVSLFACGKPAFPVDTHIRRIATRLGFLKDKVNDERAHEIMEKIVPPESYLSLHLNLIQHGREICKPKMPKCNDCCLSTHCEYFAKSEIRPTGTRYSA